MKTDAQSQTGQLGTADGLTKHGSTRLIWDWSVDLVHVWIASHRGFAVC